MAPEDTHDTNDLYAVDTSGANLRKLCGGGITNTMESCVAAAILPGNPEALILGDSKLGADSPTLRFTRGELDDFFAAYQAGGHHGRIGHRSSWSDMWI